MKLLYTKTALVELDEVYEYIALDSIKSAERVKSTLQTLISHLPVLPYMGRSIGSTGVRRIISSIYPYRVYYKVFDDLDEIHILHIVHASRNNSDK